MNSKKIPSAVIFLAFLLVAFFGGVLVVAFWASRAKTGSKITGQSSPTPSSICSTGITQKNLRNVFVMIGNKPVSLYDELITIGAFCDNKHRLLDARGKEIYLFNRHDCDANQMSEADFLAIKEADRQEIENLKKTYDTIILACPQIE